VNVQGAEVAGFLHRAEIAFVCSLAIAALLGRPVIELLRRLAYRQHAYEDAPETHQKKSGTPTMGGLLFAVAPLVTIVACLHAGFYYACAFAVLVKGAGTVGFIDDYSAIRRGRNRGLGARAKFAATLVVGVVFLIMLQLHRSFSPHVLFLPALPVWLWYALSLAAIVAAMHAVNLTDGLDGLASGTIVPPLAVLGFVGLQAIANGGTSNSPAAEAGGVAAAATIGAVFAFLIYNRHPAKMFMGDTGSLALGAALSGIAIMTGAQLLLIVIGGVFVAETLSVMIQVTYFKRTGKRVFRMSPLHHHFELGGWSETKVTHRFWIASALCSLIGFFIVVHE
jgi:phospho-N-acetylmuramoyl-pentapeptide-transferase